MITLTPSTTQLRPYCWLNCLYLVTLNFNYYSVGTHFMRIMSVLRLREPLNRCTLFLALCLATTSAKIRGADMSARVYSHGRGCVR